MMEFNVADSVNSAGFPGGSKKLRKENVAGEQGQSMLFAPMIEQASRIAIQGEATMVEHGKTEVNELTDSEMKILQKEISSSGVVPESQKPDVNNPGIESESLKPGVNNTGLKGEETIVEHGKTGTKELANPKMEILHKENSQRGVVPGSQKPGVNNHGIESGSLKSGLNNPGIESGLLKSGLNNSGIESGLLKLGLNNPGIESGLLKLGLNNSGIESGLLKSGLPIAVVGEDEAFKKSSGAMVKNGGGKNGIENLLKNQNLNSEKVMVEHGKTGVNELTDPKMEILNKEIPSSARLVDKIFSVGGYPNTTFNAGTSTAAVSESVKYYGIEEPRALINQIANGVNRAGRVNIVLTPPHLGTLDMDVIVRNNKVHIILQTENNDVRHTLQSNMETLKSALRSQGLIADNIIVMTQEKSDSTNPGFGRNETLFNEGNNQKENEENQRGRMDSLVPDPLLFDEENPNVRIDGRISLFA